MLGNEVLVGQGTTRGESWGADRVVIVAETRVAVGEAGVADYYRAEVIHGPGAFVIVAENFRDYERAMRAKLLRELQGPVIGWLAPGGRE